VEIHDPVCVAAGGARAWRRTPAGAARDAMASGLITAERDAAPGTAGVGPALAPRRHLAVSGVVLVLLATVLAVASYDGFLPLGELAVGAAAGPLYAVIAVGPAVLLTAAGVLAWWSRPASRIGLLLVAEGLAWNIGTLAYSSTYVPAAAEVSSVVVFAGYAVGGHILLSYPTGRLERRSDRILVALLYLLFGPGLIVTFLFHADGGPGCSACLANGFLIEPDATLDVVTNAGWYAVAGTLLALVGLRSVPRWRMATPVARRSLAPVYVTRWALAGSIVLWCLLGAGTVLTDMVIWGLRAQVLVNVAAVAVAFGIVALFMRSAAARAAAGELARALDASAPLAPGRLEAAIRDALHDPTARLLFRDPRRASWVDADGRTASASLPRSITPFARGAALEHDPALDDDPAAVEAVGAVAGLALEAERLCALMRARTAGAAPEQSVDGVLTPREREVLTLVAEGLTDGAIAERLVVTRRTVETHLGHVFDKLDVPSGSAHNRRVHAVRRFLEPADGTL
jgi:DNA-binding CsgD family transcriptional regulator